ncbi:MULTISPECIES: hypothetical protein [Cyanophyceae]|uniref:hypothetical protein n=1 Tax=Cyanophyceae TaxID=3028117 RepID=UPI001682C5A3|nr:hypothetical protein [Trichocoleus sp. FACHB-40]MBD2002415.1 hypothetical protein [Trichocoleus sp. FACHB-40]
MAASDDFKQKLKAGKIVEALSTALSEAIELEITTWVAKADSDREQPEPGSRMQTRINIVDGDITNEIGNQFLDTGPYSELRQFHLEQVQQSREIIQDNLKSLQKLFGIWAQMRPSNPPKLSGVESPKLPPDDAAPLVMEPEVSVVEVAIASESVIEVDTVSEAPSDPSPTPPGSGEGLLDSPSQNKSSSFPSPLAAAESSGFSTSPLAASVPAQTPPIAPTPSPETSETIVEPVLSAEEWEQALLEEPPSEPAWTATQQTVVNWGSDEEWEDVEVEEPEQRFTGWSQTGVQDDEWEGFDNWGEEEQSQPNQPQRNFTSSDRLSNPMAVLFGDIPPEEKPPSNSEMPDEETPVTFEDPFFSDIPVEPGDNNPTDEKNKKPK